jgi:hypothetical protein
MSGKEKVERIYRKCQTEIEKLTEEEIQKIKQKAEALKKETEKVGETVEASLNENKTKANKKKS